MSDIDSVKLHQLSKKFQSMSEDDFTLVVIVPLLKKLGYVVDYHGGQYEIGKDLVCWKESDFGGRDLTVVQVKKTKVAAAASVKNNFAEIISQLHQAADEAVPSISGETHTPKQVLFITPYEISTRALEMAINGHKHLASRGVRILDGTRIAELVQQHLPQLTEEICGSEFSLVEYSMTNISNADLLSALNYTKDKRISEFYCNLDFGVGKITTKFFFALQFDPSNRIVHVAPAKWIEFSKVIRATEELLGEKFTNPELSIIEEEYKSRSMKFRSKSNMATIERIARLGIEAEETLAGLVSGCYQIIVDALEVGNEIEKISASTKNRTVSQVPQAKIPVLKKLRRTSSGLWKKVDECKLAMSIEPENVDLLEALQAEVGELLEELRAEGRTLNVSSEGQLSLLFKDFKHFGKTLFDLRRQLEKRIDEPSYELSIDGRKLAGLVEFQKSWLASTLEQISCGNANKPEIKSFFIRCQDLFEKIGLLLENKLISEAMGIDPGQKYRLGGANERISMPIREVFNTGIHCAVFGEAGAGKSTTLRMYAEQSTAESVSDSVITLFLPLNRVLSNVSARNEAEKLEPLGRFELGLTEYFRSGGRNISTRDLVSFLHSKQRVVFVLDGLDEVIKTAPWIIEAILELERAYGNSQIILSSRSSGAYIDKIHYLSLTLLPFTDDQVLDFIRGWFIQDKSKAKVVEDHLSVTPTLTTIVRSPLLATILCVLADNGVPLPNGEIGMYSERMKLLLGHYDIHKKTKRISSSNNILELVSRKLAFYLHSKYIRNAPLHVLEEAAVHISKEQGWNYSDEQVTLAVRELIDPCNIIVPMTEDGEFGFDHLRYQEYLAATELIQNRGIALLPMLSQPWWKSVMVLFARMTDNIYHVFSEILEKDGMISKYRETLSAMAASRSPLEERTLLGLLEKHSKLDVLDRDLKDFYDYDHDHDYEEDRGYGLGFR